jgi:uncharacterized protein (DUF305 family)
MIRLSQTLLRVLIGLVLALSVAVPAFADAPAPEQSTAKYEIDFMQDMIDHHMMAIMQAEVCLEKAVHEKLRQLCENILATQSQEIEQMQTWLQDWYRISYEPQMAPGMRRQVEQLAQLEGAEFEIEFMQSMIKHHLRAIKEGEKCLDRAYHSELRFLCQNIIITQTQEVELMQTWLCEWYGICKDYLKR